MAASLFPFINYIILAEYVIIVLTQSISLYIFGKIYIHFLKYQVRITLDISPSMGLYILMQILTSLVTLAYVIFLIGGWQSTTTLYNAYIMYFLGAAQSHLFTLLPIAVLALGIDRCCSVLYPLKYVKRRPFYPVYVALGFMVPLTGISLMFRIIPAYPSQPSTTCYSFGCLTSIDGGQVYFYIRYFTSALILCLSTFLFILIRVKLKTYFLSNRAGKSNKLVLSTLLTTLVLDFLPNLIAVIFYSIMKVNITVYIGPYSTTISSLECAICALFYRKIFKKSIHPNQSSVNIAHNSTGFRIT